MFSKEEKYDDNILIGFFASLANFGREALNSIIQYIDLGDNNKLVLSPLMNEKLLAVAIVDSLDDNSLIRRISRNILRDFVDLYAPKFKIDEINDVDMDSIINLNLAGKVSAPLIKRLIMAWVIIIPISVLLIILNIMAIDYFFEYRPEEPLYTQSDIFTEVLPQAAFITLLELIIVMGFPNFLLGRIIINKIYSFLNSSVYTGAILLTYYYVLDPFFAYIIIFYFPLAVIISLGGAYFGYLLGLKRKIKSL
jgi:hypothetical protein